MSVSHDDFIAARPRCFDKTEAPFYAQGVIGIFRVPVLVFRQLGVWTRGESKPFEIPLLRQSARNPAVSNRKVENHRSEMPIIRPMARFGTPRHLCRRSQVMLDPQLITKFQRELAPFDLVAVVYDVTAKTE